MNNRRKWKKLVQIQNDKKKEENKMSQEVIDALKRLTKLAVAEVGDACKTDLRTVAVASGLSDSQIHANFPEFFNTADFSDVETYHDPEEDSEEALENMDAITGEEIDEKQGKNEEIEGEGEEDKDPGKPDEDDTLTKLLNPNK